MCGFLVATEEVAEAGQRGAGLCGLSICLPTRKRLATGALVWCFLGVRPLVSLRVFELEAKQEVRGQLGCLGRGVVVGDVRA